MKLRTSIDAYLCGLLIREALRRVLAASLNSPFLRWVVQGTRSAKLSIAPQDLRTADPTVAAEIYAGRFAFAGKFVAAGGRSPFDLRSPSLEWAKALYGFGWLRHLRAADSALARSNARALVEEWIDLQGGWHHIAWQPEIIARRVHAWLAQSPLVLEHADFIFYRKFVASLTRQVSYLIFMRYLMPPGLARLQVAIAIAQASLCLDSIALQRRTRNFLESELKAQILADGGHISRNPALILQLLLDLLPLRHSYVALSLMPPQALLTAIDRMMPLIRFFRHGDGAFALFNGMGPTPADIVATLLAYDETRKAPPQSAPLSGYLRVEAGDTVLLMDTGAAPPLPYSHYAHAGPLSFEFSDGPARVVVNCGMPWRGRTAWDQVARATSFHSTLEINRESCATFSSSPLLWKLLGPIMLKGPRRVTAQLRPLGVMTHQDGYVEKFGISHHRHLHLSSDGTELSGRDELKQINTHAHIPDVEFSLRFHLHPSIKASTVRDGESVLLIMPNRGAWEFRALGFRAFIEESLYLGGADGARRSEQIVLTGRLDGRRDIQWSFRKREFQPSGAAFKPEEPLLPL